MFGAVLECVLAKCTLTGSELYYVIDTLKLIVNGIQNLNVTTCLINQVKKGPFKRFVSRYNTTLQPITLDQAIKITIEATCSNLTCRKMRDAGHWGRIKTEVVNAYNEIDRQLHELLEQVENERTVSDNVRTVLKLFSGELEDCVNAMDIKH